MFIKLIKLIKLIKNIKLIKSNINKKINNTFN